MTSASPLTCPTCGQDRMLSPAFPDARHCTSCALDVWRTSEGPYEANAYCGEGQPGHLRQSHGRAAVLFTAPNAVNYWRGQTRCKAARYTGSAVEALAAATGTTSLAAAGQARTVPYRDSPEYAFADRLDQLVTPDLFVLDILGMRDRSVDVCLGLGPLPSDRSQAVADVIARGLSARGIRVAINQPFAALAPWCVAHYVQMRGGSAIQVQLAAWLRDPVSSPVMARLTLDVLRAAAAVAAAG